MKLSHLPAVLAVAVAGLLAAPSQSEAKDRKITVLRDNDGDGHFNKKTIRVGRDDDRRHYDNRYYGSRSFGNRYYGGGYPYGYGSGFGSPYRYGYGSPYGSAYRYGYGSSYYGPSVSYYRAPSYTYSTRSYAYADDTAVDVQRELKRRGYYRGGIDGDVGPGTRSAIRAYQRDRGLAATGRIDSSLLRSLGV